MDDDELEKETAVLSGELRRGVRTKRAAERGAFRGVVLNWVEVGAK